MESYTYSGFMTWRFFFSPSCIYYFIYTNFYITACSRVLRPENERDRASERVKCSELNWSWGLSRSHERERDLLSAFRLPIICRYLIAGLPFHDSPPSQPHHLVDSIFCIQWILEVNSEAPPNFSIDSLLLYFTIFIYLHPKSIQSPKLWMKWPSS